MLQDLLQQYDTKRLTSKPKAHGLVFATEEESKPWCRGSAGIEAQRNSLLIDLDPLTETTAVETREADLTQQSTINQESLVPWLTSANSSSLTVTGHNMAAMLIVPKNRQSQGGRKEGSAVGGQSALAAIY
ncbi:hypothetical protein PoB_004627800 [Plakobranchus ocellatus]|uniref:Uncharacterized protein n=1 Tax=Plakobranchus ocellatus TaxID=259542 RepID=A0AAV4BKV1_9GAST|nr:hypothetical protein PoB_004627800 [Plakobranchus ocellatus]